MMTRHNSELSAGEIIRCDCCRSAGPVMLTLSDDRTGLSVTVCEGCHWYAYERAGVPMDRKQKGMEYAPHRD